MKLMHMVDILECYIATNLIWEAKASSTVIIFQHLPNFHHAVGAPLVCTLGFYQHQLHHHYQHHQFSSAFSFLSQCGSVWCSPSYFTIVTGAALVCAPQESMICCSLILSKFYHGIQMFDGWPPTALCYWFVSVLKVLSWSWDVWYLATCCLVTGAVVVTLLWHLRIHICYSLMSHPTNNNLQSSGVSFSDATYKSLLFS